MSEEQQPKEFDLEEVYDEQISPLMAQIIEICHTHQMPIIFSVCYSWDEEQGHGLCTTHILFEGRSPEAFYEAYNALFKSPITFALTIQRGE